MEENIKKELIKKLSNKLMELMDDLELNDECQPKDLMQLFNLFTRLEDYQPQVENEDLVFSEEDEDLLIEYIKRKHNLKTKEEWLLDARTMPIKN